MKNIARIVGAASWAFFGCARAATIDISTGVAAWQVARDLPSPTYASASVLSTANSMWAVAPAGSLWVSSGPAEGTSCTVGQTPGNGCATILLNSSGDVWNYRLTISAASLGNEAGNVNFVFGADNRVDVYIGNGTTPQTWNSSNPLGCTGTPTPTSAGNSQAQYNTCTGTFSYGASALNNDGSLTILAKVHNDPISGCPSCGDPTGFVLEGDILTFDRIFKNGFDLSTD